MGTNVSCFRDLYPEPEDSTEALNPKKLIKTQMTFKGLIKIQAV